MSATEESDEVIDEEIGELKELLESEIPDDESIDDSRKEELEKEQELKDEEDVARFSLEEDLGHFKNFKIRPDIENRFQSGYVKEEIHDILFNTLKGKKYSDEDPGELTKTIANTIRNKIGGSGKIYKRYKIIVHVILGEHKGAGVKCGARCLWDPDCDTCVSEYFLNDSLFCVATVFGILFY